MTQEPEQPQDETLDDAGTEGTSAGGRVEIDDSMAIEVQLAEAQDKILRLQAELQNTRKRAQREANDMVRYAAMPLLREIIPVIDNANFGVQAAQKSPTLRVGSVSELLADFGKRVEAEVGKGRSFTDEELKKAAEDYVQSKAGEGDHTVLDGLKLLTQQLIEVLQRGGCQRIESVGQTFDPEQHSAMQQMPSADVPAMTILYEVRPGFRLHDRVVRPAEVIVSSGPPEG